MIINRGAAAEKNTAPSSLKLERLRKRAEAEEKNTVPGSLKLERLRKRAGSKAEQRSRFARKTRRSKRT